MRVTLDSLKKHALVIVVAILFATYRLSRLENERGRRAATIEQNQHLDTKYRVLRVASPSHEIIKWHAMVINGGFTIPRVEAEVVVDQQFVLDQRKQHRKKDRQSLPSVRFRVYDTEAMTSVAKTLQQHNLIASYELGHQPN
ncbi:hypothetical protein KXD40_002078 [Peronospora effusa]|uniref:Uncharacterized protein n=1 Tax=Peronospora effusa TaxID=542832 RepID=A0A3M6VI42_9STRA|nr:hypothetical protein DD238_002106 [Peronospora effusa]RQM18213.1 hypothetical protein DD237_000111 [Peronospora effusa]UIZ26802.1 hypothetical protein KXD40_002078 [Peronospora effusa]